VLDPVQSGPRPRALFWHYVAIVSDAVVEHVHQSNLTDPRTCYKLVRSDLLKAAALSSIGSASRSKNHGAAGAGRGRGSGKSRSPTTAAPMRGKKIHVAWVRALSTFSVQRVRPA